jgi:diguanylate cyclase (GGDEF)-like protein
MFESPTPASSQAPIGELSQAPPRPVFPVELESEFAEAQAASPSGSTIPALLAAGLFFHVLLIAEHHVVGFSSHSMLARGILVTALIVIFLVVPRHLRQLEAARPFLVALPMLVVAALLVNVPFHGAEQLLPFQTGIALLLLLYGWLIALPRPWVIPAAAGALIADFGALLLGHAPRTAGLPVIVESLWAPLFAVSLLVVFASVRYHEARRDFLLLRQSAFADVHAASAEAAPLPHLDPQTRVANRMAFDMRFRAAWEQAVVRRHSVALLFFSIDNFAEQKRDLGFKTAEAIQSQVAGLLKDGLRRADDMVARFDSQHFVVMLPGVGTDGVTQIAERLRGCVEEMGFFAGQQRFFVTVTVGAASVRAKRNIPREKLVDGAVHALDQARATGSNLVCVEGRGCVPRMS